MADTGPIINSLLCFLNSAKDDYENPKCLEDIVYSFYSHEEIKSAKVILCNILKEDNISRRDPDKKRKDLNDVFQFYHSLCESQRKIKFVTDSHKKIPPLGLEMIAPMLSNLSEEIMKLNEMIPKIVDIKTEVYNTADTVREMKIELGEVKQKFSCAVSGMEDAAREVRRQSTVEDIHSFRQTLQDNEINVDDSDTRRTSLVLSSRDSSVNESLREPTNNFTTETNIPGHVERMSGVMTENGHNKSHYVNRNRDRESYAGAVASNCISGDARCDVTDESNVNNNVVIDPNTGAISKKQTHNTISHNNTASAASTQYSPQPSSNINRNSANDGWQSVQSKQSKRNEKRSFVKPFKGVRGEKQGDNNMLRGVRRSVDVFVGRVEKDVSADSLREYISSNFEVGLQAITKIDIKSDTFNAFKVTVNISDRDKLLNAELWPEDIIVDKFYNRRKSGARDYNQ